MSTQISERALFARVSRRLYRERGLLLRTCRWLEKDFPDPVIGRYYALDPVTGFIRDTHIDLSTLASDLGIMAKAV